LRDLREKIERLQGIVKERNDERTALRRELQRALTGMDALRGSLQASASGLPSVDAEAELLLPQEREERQPCRIIEFPRNFHETLGAFPRHIARATMSLLGGLAAGEPDAFSGALRLKACPAVMRQRVGLDFRLLFRLLPDRIQVVDLITRQDLERKIKTLGSSDRV